MRIGIIGTRGMAQGRANAIAALSNVDLSWI